MSDISKLLCDFGRCQSTLLQPIFARLRDDFIIDLIDQAVKQNLTIFTKNYDWYPAFHGLAQLHSAVPELCGKLTAYMQNCAEKRKKYNDYCMSCAHVTVGAKNADECSGRPDAMSLGLLFIIPADAWKMPLTDADINEFRTQFVKTDSDYGYEVVGTLGQMINSDYPSDPAAYLQFMKRQSPREGLKTIFTAEEHRWIVQEQRLSAATRELVASS